MAFAAAASHDVVFLGCQAGLQDGVARDGPVRIEAEGVVFLFLQQDKEIDRPGGKEDGDNDTAVREGRLLFDRNSAALHQIVLRLLQ